MRAAAPALLLAGSLVLGACNTSPAPLDIRTYQPAPGANEVLRGEIVAAPGHSLVTGDLVLPAGAEVPPHYHHGEEFIYVIGGSATMIRPGMPDLVVGPGEGLRIPPGTVHSAVAGPEGLRAVANWVLPDGKPLRVAVDADSASD